MFELNEDNVRKYFSKKFGSEFLIEEIKKLGEGFHGVVFSIDAVDKKREKKRFILKTFKGEGFGQDYPADRASSVIRSLMDSPLLENHIKILDAGSIQEDSSLMSLGNPKDFFIIMEEVRGMDYWKDLDEIRDKKKLDEKDVERIKILAKYSATIHKQKYDGPHAEQLYRRIVRDFVGHGELTMGVIDSFPDKLDFVNGDDIVKIVKKMVEWWDKIKNKSHRLNVLHGDFYPSNIFFDGEKLLVTDRSRFRYGDAADDVSAFAINLINYSVLAYGDYRNPFKKLFEMFFEEYFKNRKDDKMFEVIPFFFAFRALVCIHPVFYSAEWMKKHGFSQESIDKMDKNKKKIVNFIKNILEEDGFKMDKINKYLGLE